MSTEVCSLCGSMLTAPHFDGDDRLYRCTQCGLVALASRLRIRDLDAYYAEHAVYAGTAENDRKRRDAERVAREYLDIVTTFTKPKQKRLLDIGAGSGVLVAQAHQHGFHASGIEKNTQLVLNAQKHGLDIREGDPLTLAVGKQYDIVTMMHVLEHLSDPRRAVRNVYRALASGGLFIIEVPNIESYPATHHRLSWKYVALEHIFYFSPTTLTRLLTEEGFKIRTVQTRNHFVDTLSMRHLLRYLHGMPITANRFKMKTYAPPLPARKVRRGWVFRFLKRIVLRCIHILRREDFVLVIAEKQ